MITRTPSAANVSSRLQNSKLHKEPKHDYSNVTVEQAAQIAELENLIFLVRHAQSNLYFHNANLLEWLTAWCENHARIGNYSGETRLQLGR